MMGRVINPANASAQRKQLLRAAAIANNELLRAVKLDGRTRDIAAFICLTLITVSQSVSQTALAWEKRDYWVKADQFSREWQWVETTSSRLLRAIYAVQFDQIIEISKELQERLSTVRLPVRNTLGAPWVGAWDRLQKEFKP